MSEAENIAQTIRKVIQDLVAPEVRELKAEVRGLRDEVKVRFDSLEARSDAQFKAIMAAIGQSKAESELSTFKAISALSERVAALEAIRH